jgi:hypothetical protein
MCVGWPTGREWMERSRWGWADVGSTLPTLLSTRQPGLSAGSVKEPSLLSGLVSHLRPFKKGGCLSEDTEPPAQAIGVHGAICNSVKLFCKQGVQCVSEGTICNSVVAILQTRDVMCFMTSVGCESQIDARLDPGKCRLQRSAKSTVKNQS